jgi:peptide/nickel transport system ATP-binding protein
MEEGPKERIFSEPTHPYTIGLIDSIPSLGHRKQRFNAIEGKTPLFSNLPEGCKFHPRCRLRLDRCIEDEPGFENVSPGHFARCVRAKELVSDGIIKDI